MTNTRPGKQLYPYVRTLKAVHTFCSSYRQVQVIVQATRREPEVTHLGHASTLYEAAFQLNSSVYPDLRSAVTQAVLPQSHAPTEWLYLPYGWHSVSKDASTLTLQPQTVTDVASLGAVLQPKTWSIPVPDATST